jgi:hypothetical protein
MTKTRNPTKSNWSSIGNLRKPNSNWRLGRAARWFEERLGLPAGTIVFVRPNGVHARINKTLNALREEWKHYHAGL